MKLIDLPRNTFFTIVGDESNTVLRFERLDGSYSVCWNEYDRLVHISPVAKVKEVNSYEK